MLTSLDYVDKPAEHTCLCAHNWPKLFPIHNKQLVSANFSYQFLNKFAIGGTFFLTFFGFHYTVIGDFTE
jgi:hypothetical protein